MVTNGFTNVVSRLIALSGALILMLQGVALMTPLYLELTSFAGAAGSPVPGNPEQFLWRQLVGAWSILLAWTYFRWSPLDVSRRLPQVVPLFHLFAFACSAAVIVYGSGGRYLVFLFAVEQLVLLSFAVLITLVQSE